MFNQRRNYGRHDTLIVPLVVIALAAAVIVPNVIGAIRYHRAEEKAMRRYGDKRQPLTVDERNEWYRDMGVREKYKPDLDQLKSFLEKSVVNN